MLQDLNIGIALWLAAGGDGWVDGGHCKLHNNHQRYRYKSTARILLVGSGADEQCAGYGRHRTKYRLGGYDFFPFATLVRNIMCIISYLHWLRN